MTPTPIREARTTGSFFGRHVRLFEEGELKFERVFAFSDYACWEPELARSICYDDAERFAQCWLMTDAQLWEAHP